MKSKQKVGGIFCDLHKTFDCTNRVVLLEKLKFYGVSRKFYNLVKCSVWVSATAVSSYDVLLCRGNRHILGLHR